MPPVSHRALVVDDDAAIRKLIVKLLERRGFDAGEAETGDAAITMAMERRLVGGGLRRRGAGDDGARAVSRAVGARGRARHPLAVFIASEKAPSVNEAAMAGVPTLVKPFTASDLEAALTEAGVAAPRAG